MFTKARHSGPATILVLAALGASGCGSIEKFVKTKEGAAVTGGVIAGGIAKAVGADTGETLGAVALGGLIGYIIADASESEQREAEAKAARTTARLQQQEIDRLRAEQRVYMMRVDEKTYVPVDPTTGKAIGTKKVELDEDPFVANPDQATPVATTDGGRLLVLERDGVQVGGDTFNVYFADPDADSTSGPSQPDDFNPVFVEPKHG